MRILSDMPPSARYTIICQGIWASIGKVVLFYAPLYMKGTGLTEVQIGFINTVNLLFSFIWYFLASPINNRLGRKRTIIIFDLLCWSIPMIIWAVADNFWVFLIAAIINSTVKVSSVAWYCLLSEDVEGKKRARAFGVVNLIAAVPGMFMPVAGIAMSRFGIVPTMRVLYFSGFFIMTAGFFIRNAYITETRAGMVLMKKNSGLSFINGLKDYMLIVVKAYRNKHFVVVAMIYVIANFTTAMNFVQVLYLKDHLGFGEDAISVSQVVATIVNIFFCIVLIPRLKNLNEEKTLATSLAVCAAGSILFMLIPGHNISVMLLVIAISTIGNYLMITYRDAVFLNSLGEHEKSDMFSAIQILTALVSIPAGYVAGATFVANPVYPFTITAVLFIIAMFISLSLVKNTNTKQNITRK